MRHEPEPARSGEQPPPDTSSKNYVYSGDNSVVSILRSRASDATDSVAREVGSVLGLQNTFSTYPFMNSKTPHERWRSLLGVLPQRNEVLKYVFTAVEDLTDVNRFFHYYRVTAYPFNPILADIDRFESDLCIYLNAHANDELRDPEQISDRWATDKSIGHIGLLLAILAAGAHYSDIDYPQRLELSTDFGRSDVVMKVSSTKEVQLAGRFTPFAWLISSFARPSTSYKPF